MLALIWSCASLTAENAYVEIGGGKVRLSGVLRVHDSSWAFLVPEKEFDDTFPRPFREGEEYGGFAASKISLRPTELTMEKAGEKAVLSLQEVAGDAPRSEKDAAVELKLQDMPLRQLVDVFQTLSGRCVVRGTELKTAGFTISGAGNRKELLLKMQEAMEREGLELTNIAEKITVFMPKGKKIEFPGQRTRLAKVNAEEVVPSGGIWLSNMPFDQFRQIYEIYAGVKVVSAEGVRPVSFTIRQEIDMTRAEVVHALELLYAVNGIRVEDQGEGEVKLTAMPK